MKQTGTGSRTGIKPEKPANYIAVVGDIETVLESGSADMMSDTLQPGQFRAGNYIANAIIETGRLKILAGTDSFQHYIRSLSVYSELP